MKYGIEAIGEMEVYEAMDELKEMLDQIDNYLCDIEAGISFPLENMKGLHANFMKSSLINMWLSEEVFDYLNEEVVEGWEDLYLKAVRLEAECFLFYEKYQFNKKFATKEERNLKLKAVVDLVMDKISDSLGVAENHLSLLESDDIFLGDKQEILSLYRLMLPSTPLLLMGTEPEERDIIFLAHKDKVIDYDLYEWFVEEASELQKRLEAKMLELGNGSEEDDGGFGEIEMDYGDLKVSEVSEVSEVSKEWRKIAVIDESVDEITKLINSRGSKVLS